MARSMRSIVAVLGLALAALLSATAPSPATARTIPCPDGEPVSVREVLAMAGDYGGYWGPIPRLHACFGDAPILVAGVVNRPDGLGGTSTSGVTPM